MINVTPNAIRKRAADPNQPQKSGAAKPTNVSTDPKRKMKENYFNRNKSIDEMAGKIVKSVKVTKLKPNLKAQAQAVKDARFSDDFDRTMESGVKDSPEAKKIKQDKIKKSREAFRTGQKQVNEAKDKYN